MPQLRYHHKGLHCNKRAEERSAGLGTTATGSCSFGGCEGSDRELNGRCACRKKLWRVSTTSGSLLIRCQVLLVHCHCCSIPVSQCHCLWAQAFLETEPGFRSTTEEYMMRYQTFARDELVKALDKHKALLKSVGNHDKAEGCYQHPLLRQLCRPFRLQLAHFLATHLATFSVT